MAARWREIERELREAIEEGRYGPGERLPTEEELAERYGVVRNTVRKALAELTAAGLVTARPRRGRVVAVAPVSLTIARYATVVDSERARPDLGPWETACHEQGVEGHTELVSVEEIVGEHPVVGRLGVGVGEELVRRRRRMWAEDRVEQVQDAWMPLALVAGTPLAVSGKVVGGVYAAMLRAGLVPARATEEVACRIPTLAEAGELDVALGTPVIEQWRTTFDPAGRALEVLRAVTGHCVFVYEVPIGASSAAHPS